MCHAVLVMLGEMLDVTGHPTLLQDLHENTMILLMAEI